MSKRWRQEWIVLVAGSLLLAGCASHPRKPEYPPAPAAAGPQVLHPATPAPKSNAPAAANEELPPAPGGMVGVASCDQYLSTYKACHRAAGIFAPDQIEARYEMMRNSLLRDARDPAKRPALDGRCRALSSQLHESLHGKSCNAAPAPNAGGDD